MAGNGANPGGKGLFAGAVSRIRPEISELDAQYRGETSGDKTLDRNLDGKLSSAEIFIPSVNVEDVI